MLNTVSYKASSKLSSNATFLNKMIASTQPARNFASVAFNIKSKFE